MNAHLKIKPTEISEALVCLLHAVSNFRDKGGGLDEAMGIVLSTFNADQHELPLKDFYGRKEAVHYLRIAHAIVRTEATLAKYASLGGGPKFHKAGRRQVLYAREDLDEWAIAVRGKAISSTSSAEPNDDGVVKRMPVVATRKVPHRHLMAEAGA